MEAEKFIGKITKIGNSLAIIIPKKNTIFSGLNVNDLVQVWYKKNE